MKFTYFELLDYFNRYGTDSYILILKIYLGGLKNG